MLAARGEKPVASATFLTTLMDFTDTGILDVFIDEAFVSSARCRWTGRVGCPGRTWPPPSASCGPTTWSGTTWWATTSRAKRRPPFDLLYWNSDSTNLPGPFYAWYLRNTYLENNSVKPGKATVCGEKIDLGKVDIPVYIYGSREDHIVPIEGAYASTQVLPGKKRFVMGPSGHIAGVINPPAKGKRSHWIRADGKLPATHGRLAGRRHRAPWQLVDRLVRRACTGQLVDRLVRYVAQGPAWQADPRPPAPRRSWAPKQEIEPARPGSAVKAKTLIAPGSPSGAAHPGGAQKVP